MKKILFLMMAISMPLILSSCSNEEELTYENIRTRGVEYWYGEYDAAYDGFWECVDDWDADAQLLSTTTWLPYKIKSQFIGALWEGGSTTDNPEYPWEKTAYVVREVLEWGGEDGNKPKKIRYTLWALEVAKINGKEMFRYIIPETFMSFYTVELDPWE